MTDRRHDAAAGQHRPRRAKGGVVPAAPAESESKAPRRRGRLGRWKIPLILLSILLVLVLIASVIVFSYISRLQSAFDDERNVIEDLQLEDETTYRTPEGTINMLLLGTDSRGEEEQDYREATGESSERSDTMMFVHIPEDRSGVYVMSIMRDLWVDIPGEGQGRINQAYGVGDMPLVVETLEEMLYTHIDHVAVIDFEGFEDLTTALDGVYVDNPRSFSAGQRNPAFYPEGTIRLEGSDALRFVRERYSFVESDYVRVENQQLVVRAIVERFLSGDTLTNPQRILNVVEGIVPYMEVDEGLDSETVAAYAYDLRHLRSPDVHMFTMPTGDPTVTAGGAEVLLPDEEMLMLRQRSLNHENMDGFLEHLTRVDDDASGFGGQEDSVMFRLGESMGESVGGAFTEDE